MASITKKELLKSDPKLRERPYQIETRSRCLVKML